VERRGDGPILWTPQFQLQKFITNSISFLSKLCEGTTMVSILSNKLSGAKSFEGIFDKMPFLYQWMKLL